MMRYVSTGEVHKDFHGLACATLHYILDNYGVDALKEILACTAKDVYRSIHDGLKRSDVSELAEFWNYYMKRENGDFSIERFSDGVRIVVHDCPALRHLVSLGKSPDPILCDATRIFDEALAEGTPFRATVTRTGRFSCVRQFKKSEVQR